jgi:hypothetical protein
VAQREHCEYFQVHRKYLGVNQFIGTQNEVSCVHGLALLVVKIRCHDSQLPGLEGMPGLHHEGLLRYTKPHALHWCNLTNDMREFELALE